MTRTLILAAAVLSAGYAAAQTPQRGAAAQPPLFRHATVHHAWRAAQQTRLPMLVYVTSDRCTFCKKMIRETLSHPQIGRGVAGYSEPVLLDASKSPDLAKKLGVRAYPTTLVISPSNKLLHKIEGFVEPEEFAERVWPVFRQAAAARRVAARQAAAADAASTTAASDNATR